MCMRDALRLVCFYKQKTAYEVRISDWSSDVCSSDLKGGLFHHVSQLCNHSSPISNYIARMEQTTLAALSAFAFATSITPGPNNMMLMASGANFGLRRTVPHALGVGIGFTLMIILVGVGLMELFDLFPILNLILKVVSVAYLLWLQWKIANAAAPETGGRARGKPMSFAQAKAFRSAGES